MIFLQRKFKIYLYWNIFWWNRKLKGGTTLHLMPKKNISELQTQKSAEKKRKNVRSARGLPMWFSQQGVKFCFC